jgi:hypothetical protein
MKKNKLFAAVVLFAALLFASGVHAQDVNGKNFVNAGIGLGTYGFSGTGGLPITASFEHGFSDKISAGIYAGFIQRKYVDAYKYKYTVIGVRGSYHFNEVLNVTNPKLDVYGGISLYYRGYTLKYDFGGETEKATAGEVDFGLHVGTRYMFSDNVGGFAELGYGISPLQLGVSFKF